VQEGSLGTLVNALVPKVGGERGKVISVRVVQEWKALAPIVETNGKFTLCKEEQFWKAA